MYSFSYLEPVCFSMSSSNCCFLTCIQVSQEADQVVWYAYLLKNFPQFIVIHTVKGFGIDNRAEVYVFLNSLAFSMIQQMLAILSLVPLPFLKPETSALLTMPKHLTVWLIINWKVLQEMGIPDHLTCLLSNLYAGQEATVRTGHGKTD